MEKPKVALPIVVEGRYDKIKLDSLIDATVVTTDGFSLFHDKEKLSLLRRLGAGGLIILTDADGGGKQIRSFLSGALGDIPLYHLHTPRIEGKEKRKRSAGRAGILGVEGMEKEQLLTLLSPFFGAPPTPRAALTKADLYADGLLGSEGSAARRAALAVALSLPPDLTPNALLAAVNLLCSEEEYRRALGGEV